MIPLLAISKFIAFVFGVFATLKLRQSWKNNPGDEAIYCFYKFFFYLNFVFLPFLIPAFEVGLGIVQICFYITNFFIFVCLAYLVRIVLLLTYLKKFRKIIFWIFILAAFGEIILDIIYFEPAKVLTYQFANFHFIGWILEFPSFLTITHGILTAAILGLAAFVFLVKGYHQTNRYLKARSYLLGVGIFFLLVAAIGYLFFGSLVLLNLDKDIIHGLASVISLIFIVLGIYYKKEKVKIEDQDGLSNL